KPGAASAAPTPPPPASPRRLLPQAQAYPPSRTHSSLPSTCRAIDARARCTYSSGSDARSAAASSTSIPAGMDVDEAAALRASDPDEYVQRARASIARHVEGRLECVRLGGYACACGNNLRGEAGGGGVGAALAAPGF